MEIRWVVDMMENEFTEEEIEAIKLSDEMLEDMHYQDGQQRKFHANEVKTDINKRNLVNRQFKSVFCDGLKIVALVTAAIISFTAGMNSAIANNDENIQAKSAMVLETEIEIHGGKKDMSTDKYIWNFDDHIESGKCAIPKEENLTIEGRIEKYCKDNSLSDEIADAAIAKFNLYYSNNIREADKIDLVRMVKEEQKLLAEENSHINGK